MSYTIKELSDELGINKKTCLRWIASGLKIVGGSKKPILIMGSDLKDFLRNKGRKKKVKLNRSEFYCFSCRVPRRAKRGSIKKLKGTKTGLCHVCNGRMCRIFEPYQKDYQISLFPT